MELATRVQILDVTICVSLGVNNLWKSISSATNYDYIAQQTALFSSVWQTVEKENELKPAILSLTVDLVSHPFHGRGAG